MSEVYSSGTTPNRTNPTRVIEVKILEALNNGGGGGGVSQILAGTNITVSPSGGTGEVTVSAAGGSGNGTTLAGTGSPNGVQTAAPGSTYTQTDTGSFWVKQTGTGNTGWLEIVT